jgi:hypothetical protein
MVSVLLDIQREDQDVIKIYHNKVIKIFPENVIHHMLKHRRSIGEAEWHYLILEMTIAGAKGSFPFISRLDPHQVVCSPKVNLREESCSSEVIQQLWDER